MKFLFLLVALTNFAYADWSIESKEIFNNVTKDYFAEENGSYLPKYGQATNDFIETYILNLNSSRIVGLSMTLSNKSQKAFIFSPIGDKRPDLEKCETSSNLTDCLFGSYDSYIFVVLSKSGKIESIGNSNLLPRNEKRFGHSLVEQEAFFFTGERSGKAVLENW